MAARQEQEINLIKGLLARFEKHPLVEVPTSPEVPSELRSYVEKVEEGAEFNLPVVVGGQAPGAQTAGRLAVVVLPLTKSQYVQAKQASISDSIRWLAALCLKLFKVYRTKAAFRPEPNL